MTKEQFIDITKKTGFKIEEESMLHRINIVTNDDRYYVAKYDRYYVAKYDTDRNRVCCVFPGPFARRLAKSISDLIWYGDTRKVHHEMTCEELENYLLDCKKKEKEIIKEFRLKQIKEL